MRQDAIFVTKQHFMAGVARFTLTALTVSSKTETWSHMVTQNIPPGEELHQGPPNQQESLATVASNIIIISSGAFQMV